MLQLGAGISVRKLTVNQLASAISVAVGNSAIRAKASFLGEQIRKENGVQTAINFIYRDLEFARERILHLKQMNESKHSGDRSLTLANRLLSPADLVKSLW